MRKNMSIVIIVVIIAVLCLVFFSMKNRDAVNEGDNQSDVEFFKQIISVENSALIEEGKYDELSKAFEPYCNERGLDVVMSNREIRYNYDFIDDYNIKDYKDLSVELLDESADNATVFREYKIEYTYIDTDGKEYKMTDYYNLNVKDGKIDYVKLDTSKSSISNTKE